MKIIREMVKRLTRVEEEMSREKGPFLLFALFQPEGSTLRLWDIVVSAPWIEKDRAQALDYIAGKVTAHLTPAQLMNISRIIFIEPENPGLQDVRELVQAEHGLTDVRDEEFFGLPIRRAYIVTSRNTAA